MGLGMKSLYKLFKCHFCGLSKVDIFCCRNDEKFFCTDKCLKKHKKKKNEEIRNGVVHD